MSSTEINAKTEEIGKVKNLTLISHNYHKIQIFKGLGKQKEIKIVRESERDAKTFSAKS